MIPANTIIPVLTSLDSFKRFGLWFQTKLGLIFSSGPIVHYFNAWEMETLFPFL